MAAADFLKSANFRQRFLSALVMMPMTLLVIWVGGWLFIVTVTAVTGIGLHEWMKLFAGPKRRAAVALWMLQGLVYVGSCGYALLYLRAMPQGMELVLYLVFVVWGTDIGAYVFGKLIGGAKLAPQISPNKTWAGFFGGMALAAAFGYAVAAFAGARQPLIALGLAVVLAVAAQMGDLFKSYFKRRAGVKDSGRLIPGHGGVLDRIDGLIFASVALALFQASAGADMQWM